MQHNHWFSSAIALVALNAAPAALPDVYPQGPVALKSLVPLPATGTKLPLPAAGDPVYDFLALRNVLNDLGARAQYLQAEATLLQKDADNLWREWRRVFGSRSFGPHEQRIQVKAFALYSEARRNCEQAQALERRLGAEELRWQALSRLLEDQAARSDAAIASELGRLRAALSKLAGQANGLNEDVRKGQRRLDTLYPPLTALLQGDSLAAAALRQPWHWTYYMTAGQTRPALRYDFELEYEQALDEARSDFAARAAGRTESLRVK